MHSLRTKITAIPVAAIILSLLAAVGMGFLTVGEEVGASSARQMHLLSENESLTLDSYLTDIEQGVEIASHFATGSLDAARLMRLGAKKRSYERTPEQTAELDAYLHEHAAYVQEAFANVASHTDGIVSYYYCLRPELSQTEHGFFFMRKGKVGFEQRAALDASKLDPLDSDHNTWYYTPIGLGTPCWVGPYHAESTDEALTVSYLMPIYKSGILVGVLGMDLMFDTMVEQLRSLKVFDTGFAALLDEAGRVLYHPEYGTSVSQNPDAPVFTSVRLDRTSNGNQAIIYDREGKQWQLAYSTLTNGMRLVITAPVDEVNASWLNLLRVVPIVAILILVVIVPITLFVTRVVSQPLHELTDAAHRLAEGDYDIQLDYHGNNEVGELTDAFRKLRDHLNVYTSNINSTSFVDGPTGVKNKQAFELAAAQLDDMVREGEGTAQFALVVLEHAEAAHIAEHYGRASCDEAIKALCDLICQVFGREAAYRVDESRFVVLLQGRGYANREELACDFDILSTEANLHVVAPWLYLDAAMGKAMFEPGRDANVASVLSRAEARMRARMMRRA